MQAQSIRNGPGAIAVLSERSELEQRVALDPRGAEQLLKLGFQVRVQSRAGIGAAVSDDDFAAIESLQVFPHGEATLREADIVLRATPPTPEQIQALPEGCLLISRIEPWRDERILPALQARHVTTLALELMPRIARMQPMDVLASQATVAGLKAALLAAELSPRLFPLLMTAAGTVKPARVLVIGAGVAGMQAIATARRLGARVEATDVRRQAEQQIASLGARLVVAGIDAEERTGVARRLTEAERQHQSDEIAVHLTHADVVITAVQGAVRKAPRIVTAEMLKRMPPQSVLIDMAADSGCNCEVTVPGEIVQHGLCRVAGPLDLASRGAVHASAMLSSNHVALFRTLLQDAAFDGRTLTAIPNDDALAAMVLTMHGEPQQHQKSHGESASPSAAVVHKPVAVDDLKRIDGIGPVLEGKLHEFGFLAFADLAAVDEARRIRLEQQLELEDGEILKRRWVEQAQALTESSDDGVVS